MKRRRTMTNDLPNENIAQGAAPEEERTVFSPSPWGRRKEEKPAAAKTNPPDDTAARLEAKRLELKIAQENRKAQEEQRHREAKAREEELRQERKAQEQERREQDRQHREEDRQRRREEKAEQASVRRVGTLTLGLSLIAIGAAILAYMVNPSFDIRIVAYLAPVILIGLGAEILIRQLIGKGKPFRYDFASGFICILLIIGSFAVALVPYVLYYISPERYSTQEEQLNIVRDKVYTAFQGEQRVRNYNVYGNVNEVLSAAHVDENGKWTYELDYLGMDISLMDGCDDEAAFAGVCRQLMDRLQTQDISIQGGDGRGDSFVLHFSCPENDRGISYNLWINNRLKMDMDASSLAKLVDVTYSVPTRENGWIPDGYEELRENFGEMYAEHFAELMEQFGPEEAGRYYTILMDTYLIDIAEMYYNGCINGPVMQVPEGEEVGTDETEDENRSVPVANLPDETPPATEDENTSVPAPEEAPITE